MRRRPPRTALMASVLLAAPLVAACAPTASPTVPAVDRGDPVAGAPVDDRHDEASLVCTPAPLERRAAAVLVVGLPGVTTLDDPLGTAVVDLGVGGLFISESNVEDADQLRALVSGLRERSKGPLLV